MPHIYYYNAPKRIYIYIYIRLTNIYIYIYIGETNFRVCVCVWEMSANENVPNEKILNCTNVAEINILEIHS